MENIKKITQPLFLIVLVLALLIFLKTFLIPFAYGLLVALIVYPICQKMESKKVPRSLAIFFSILLVSIAIGFIALVFVLQFQVITKELPVLMDRLYQLFPYAQEWINTNLGLSIPRQDSLIITMEKDLFSNIGNFVSGSFSLAAETLFNAVIIPLYAVLILYYRGILVDFTAYLIGEKYRKDLPAILSEAIHMYFNYIKGMFWVYLTVGVLNSIGLLILGVDYAILFGMVTAFMTIIPYVGIIVSSILPITMVWAETNNFLYPLGVVAIFSLVQYLEANLIFPYIVGKQIGINMFVSIVAIIFGGVIWGLSGMVLFLPFIAILKIVSGHIEGLKPINKLLEIPR